MIKSARFRSSQDAFRHLVEQVKDYAIFTLDPEGHVSSWNEGAQRIKGYSADEVIGKHFSIFYPPEDRERYKPAFELQMARELGRYEDEGWRLRKDGSRFWASVVITTLRESEQIIGFLKITRDLTERKVHEESLQKLLEEEERFRLSVEQVKDYAIFMLDPKGRVISWNKGALHIKGYSADEIIGKHFSIFYLPEDIATDKPNFELSMAIKEGRFQDEGWRVRKDGSRFWANVVITALWDKKGNLSGFAKVSRDLTERKLHEEMLLRKTRELEAFAHTLSHDLRAPLRAISGFSQALEEDCGLDLNPQARDYLRRIGDAEARMETLIDDILRYSEVSLAKIPVEAVPLSEVFQEILQTFAPDIKRTGAQVHLHDSLPAVRGTRTMLVQVFSNLIGNALKFVPAGRVPNIDVRCETREALVKISVTDNGIGIDKDHWPRVFDLFERLQTSEKFPGTGIGLAIVHKAVERLNGRIEVESSTPGQGSTFAVWLPVEPNG